MAAEDVEASLPASEGSNGERASSDHHSKHCSSKELPSDEVLDDRDAFKVAWTENDPRNPMNWSSLYRAWLAFQLAMLSFVGSFGASIMSPAQGQIAVYLHLPRDTAVLAVSLYVLGFAFGSMLWAPLAEVHGRKLSIIPAMFVAAMFEIGTATSTTAAAVFATRFLAGVFASASISNTAAAIGDFYSARKRGIPMALMSICIVGGPCLAPLVGASIAANSKMGWRWTAYMHAIMTLFLIGVSQLCLPETYHPVLLRREARRLRKVTGDSRHWHPQEQEKIKLSNVVTKYIGRPGRMLFTEPMVACISVYASYVFGLLFFLVQSFVVVFHDIRGYSIIVSTLPFIGMLIGIFFALVINLANQGPYAKAVSNNKGRPVPEARLPPMLLGGVLFSTGMLFFGWTSGPQYHWILPTIAAGFLGAGFNVVFQQCLNFLADTYGPYTASAMSVSTVLRSVLGCTLPLAAGPMFTAIGVGPGCSLLGGLSCLALPVPLIFMKYGLKLRKMSKFAPVPED
ncbi:related to benomyl/methotrexate resistance protein [Ramularia collo-cygni]|uniref:Cercosporin MFS transporter CTB4 n=1 Tax=Ramularia collo-cygni TaxID=112498 RepID=A0A2D3VAX7_9PEZI|nr:related to benomyl/methotrexate resistance protein [Ramularia collo-cygni]CZT17613.1 related to benomyl/methotrexate resistance protein [Ramularia collo-cygni]